MSLERILKGFKQDRNGLIHDENQYLNLIRDIIDNGTDETGRNGNVRCIFGSAMHFSLKDGIIPIMTTKKLAWKTCLRELLWFIHGDTNNKILKDQNVKIWNGNASREFLDSRGLTYPEDDLGPIYGHQWRHFNAPYESCNTDYSGKGIDQLMYIINALKHPNPIERQSRRLVMSAWNPCQLDEMALPPCHVLCQFNVSNGNQLSCALYQRSGDVGLGVPFNIASYSFLTHLIAKHCNMEATDFYYYLGNAHIYDDHLDSLKEQIIRVPFEFPHLNINQSCDSIDDYTEDMFELCNYTFHETIKIQMRK
jgi:thymidylate synthase